MIPKLTPEQAIIVTGYTGFMCCELPAFYEDVKKRTGQDVNIPLSFIPWEEKIRPLYAKDFLEMMP